jgi:xylulokinase
MPAPNIGSSSPSIFLGLDLSTQSLKAVALSVPGVEKALEDLEAGLSWEGEGSSKVIWEETVNYEEALGSDGVVRSGARCTQGVSTYLRAFDELMRRARADPTMGRMLKHVRAIGGCAQQHGAVYWASEGEALLRKLNESSSGEGNNNQDDSPTLYAPLEGGVAFSRSDCSIWMDSSTEDVCEELNLKFGEDVVSKRTGAAFTPRFTGPQLAKFARDDPEVFQATSSVQLISTFLTSLLLGAMGPADFADSSGQNMVDLRTREYDSEILAALDPSGALPSKLSSPIVPSCTVVGVIGGVLRGYGFSPSCQVVAITGDNPSTAASMNLNTSSAAISLGTSDTLMTTFSEIDEATRGSDSFTFPNPTKDQTFINMTCCTNGGTVRAQACSDIAGGDWSVFDRIISSGSGKGGGDGGGGRSKWLMKCPVDESSPRVPRGNFRSGGRWIPEDELYALVLTRIMHLNQKSPKGLSRIMLTGGGSRSPAIAQLIADVFGADVWHVRGGSGNAAALGGSLMALQGFVSGKTRAPVDYSDISGKIAEAGWEVWKTPDGAMEDFYASIKDDYREWEMSVVAKGVRKGRGKTLRSLFDWLLGRNK